MKILEVQPGRSEILLHQSTMLNYKYEDGIIRMGITVKYRPCDTKPDGLRPGGNTDEN